MDEDDDYASDAVTNETNESDEGGDSSMMPAPARQGNSSSAATDDNEGGNLPDKRRSLFTDIDMPEISIRRRTRIVGAGGDESNVAGSAPSSDTGTIAQASRIITELEQDHRDLDFPLDALRRDSRGFGDDDNDDGK